ncbi:MAG: hypothetical protein LUF92_11395 [Clostridiales bacterium]|nr:hypothetical protein [Clostridiales bacterium]
MSFENRDMVNVTIIDNQGTVYNNPEEIKISRNEKTESFYYLLETFCPSPKDHSLKENNKKSR